MSKKSGIGAVLALGGIAVAAGIAYLKREQIKLMAEEVIARIKETEEEGVFAADVNCDGVDETLLVDTDGDGLVDAVIMDTDGDGEADAAAIDTDGDGEADLIVTDIGAEEE